MRGNQRFLWACVAALVLLLGPVAGVAAAAEKPFIAPVQVEVIRGFEAPSHRFGSGHRGIDYGVAPDTPVKASGAGTVTFAGPVAGDLYITIQHLGGIATTYSYLNRIDVAQGDQVTQGQVIASSGDGHDGGPPSLHFGAKLNGEYIDPMRLLLNLDDITELLQLTPQIRSGVHPSGQMGFPIVQPPDGSGGQQSEPTRHGNGSNASLDAVPVHAPQLVGGAGARVAVQVPDHQPSAVIEGAVSPQREDKPRPALRAPGQAVPSDAKWWGELPGEFKQKLLAEDPNRWENFRGLSAKERSAINQRLLKDRLEQLKQERNSKEGGRAQALHTAKTALKGMIDPSSIVSKFDRESELDRKIRSAEALLQQLEARAPRDGSESDVYLLDFDTDFAGGDGKAVVAFGDPGTADHIGVIVPGINNAVGTVHGSLRDADKLKAEAARVSGPDVKTSTIVWMGYDNPNGFQDAGNRAEAYDGAPDLKGFVNDLRSQHVAGNNEPHITVFGHSYGSTVTGIAALEGMKADDVVFLGSPGVGRFFVDSDDFSQRVWAGRTRNDPIALVAGALGADPMAKAFGARKVPLANFQTGHSAYFNRSSRGLNNLAKILTGRPEDLK